MRLIVDAAIAACFITALAVGTEISHAQSEVTMFGPKQYDKPKGAPVTYTDTFKSISGIVYTLWVQSGLDGLNEAKNVSISINGIEVMDSSDLRKNNPSARTINAQPDNIIKVVLKGQGGNFVKIRMGVQPLNITIASPSDGETLAGPEIVVRGRIANLLGKEVGVTVNGMVAQLYGNDFFVSHVPLTTGTNIITARATDAAGNSADATVTVSVALSDRYIKMTSNLTSGLAPLQALFSATASNFTPVSYSMDFEGDGIIDYTGADVENMVHTYESEGTYFPRLEAVDSQGSRYSSAIALTVFSRAEITALLKGRWHGMREALKAGDVEGALAYFIEGSRERYRQIFEALRDQLPQIMETFVEFNILDLYENTAQYEVVANEDGELYSYPGALQKDGNGIWKFRDF